MERVQYDKLIRDGVVDRMRRMGVAFEVRIIDSEDEFRRCLVAKVSEEASGVVRATEGPLITLMDEIADLERVLVEIKKVFGIDEKEMALVRKKNFHEKGGFDARAFLLWSQSEGYVSNEKK